MNSLHTKISKIKNADLKSILIPLANKLLGNNPATTSVLLYEVIKSFGIFVEYKSAYLKSLNTLPSSINQEFISNIMCIDRFLKEPFIFCNSLENVSGAEFENLLGKLNQIENLHSFLDFVISDKWDCKINGKEIKLTPTIEQEKAYFNERIAAAKVVAKGNYFKNLTDGFGKQSSNL